MKNHPVVWDGSDAEQAHVTAEPAALTPVWEVVAAFVLQTRVNCTVLYSQAVV
jgi:hypothetical protein